jgi:hypothetical protein
MKNLIQTLGLSFFRTLPEGAEARPPLLSSLQSLETSFYLISLERYPAALIACASAWESLLRSHFGIPEQSEVRLSEMLERFRKERTHFSRITAAQVREFREARNRMIHNGFSPQDDGYSVRLLLSIGFPYLFDLHRESLGVYFDWRYAQPGAKNFLELKGNPKAELCIFRPDFGDLLLDAISTWSRFKNDAYLVNSPLHLLRFRQKLKSSLTGYFSTRTERYTVGFLGVPELSDEDQQVFDEQRESLSDSFENDTWEFWCPFCHHFNAFIAEFDEDAMDKGCLKMRSGACADCDSYVAPEGASLLNYWLREQLEEKSEAIWLYWRQ